MFFQWFSAHKKGAVVIEYAILLAFAAIFVCCYYFDRPIRSVVTKEASNQVINQTAYQQGIVVEGTPMEPPVRPVGPDDPTDPQYKYGDNVVMSYVVSKGVGVWWWEIIKFGLRLLGYKIYDDFSIGYVYLNPNSQYRVSLANPGKSITVSVEEKYLWSTKTVTKTLTLADFGFTAVVAHGEEQEHVYSASSMTNPGAEDFTWPLELATGSSKDAYNLQLTFSLPTSIQNTTNNNNALKAALQTLLENNLIVQEKIRTN